MEHKLPRCPVATTLSILHNKWTPLIWCAIYYGKKRFGEIHDTIGDISTKALTLALRDMEEKELITRIVYGEVPPRVEYTLTPLGLSLKPVLYAMVDWGSSYKYMVEELMPVRSKDGILMTIAKAKPEDLASILSLQYLAYQSEANLLQNPNIPPLKQTLSDLETEYQHSTILKLLNEKDSIIGSVRAYSKADSLFIGKLFIHPDYQGQGLGSKLLLEIERICPHNRSELFTSSASLRNLSLYQHLGYQVFRKEKLSDKLTFLYLEKFSSLSLPDD